MTVAKRGIMTGLSAAKLAAGYSAISLPSLENSEMLEIRKSASPETKLVPSNVFRFETPEKRSTFIPAKYLSGG
ncbi:MAG: hypothetical protein EPO28_16190 [Saprospiraceae bacterium]|nr:MAG: hypothetical protein EPO28_16190 [Saprospiraceae bacterium]